MLKKQWQGGGEESRRGRGKRKKGEEKAREEGAVEYSFRTPSI